MPPLPLVTTPALAAPAPSQPLTEFSMGGSASPVELPASFHIIGLLLALSSSAFIGGSFILQKKGMISAAAKAAAARSASGKHESPAHASTTAMTVASSLPATPAVLRTRMGSDPTESTNSVLAPLPLTDEEYTPVSDALAPVSPTVPETPRVDPGRRRSKHAGAVGGKASAGKKRRRGPLYLYSKLWWVGTASLLVGEAANLGAYAFTTAMVVTPLGALSVVVSAILSSMLLKEVMNLQGKLGCGLILIGATILVLNAPTQASRASMSDFASAYLSARFIAWQALVLVAASILLFWVARRRGGELARRNPLVYLGICSLLGSLSVVEIQAVGTSLVSAAAGAGTADAAQPWAWALFWIALVKAIIELLAQLHYLNSALSRFSTVLVTPIYYALFTSATLLANWILSPPWAQLSGQTIATCILSFAVICTGMVLLQTSKISTAATTAGAHATSADRNAAAAAAVVVAASGGGGAVTPCVLSRDTLASSAPSLRGISTAHVPDKSLAALTREWPSSWLDGEPADLPPLPPPFLMAEDPAAWYLAVVQALTRPDPDADAPVAPASSRDEMAASSSSCASSSSVTPDPQGKVPVPFPTLAKPDRVGLAAAAVAAEAESVTRFLGIATNLDLRCDDSNHVAHGSAAESAAVAPPPPPARAPPAPAPSAALVTFLAELADLAADLDPPALTFASPFASLASLIAYLMVAILGQFATLALVLVTWSHRRRSCLRRRPNGKRLRYRRHRVDVADVTAMGAPDTLWMAEQDPPAAAEGMDADAARPDAPAPAAALPSPLAMPSPVAVDELKIVRGCECGRCHARMCVILFELDFRMESVALT
ncbi:hypothetical protein AMAG_18183 [Allomyces macrogynus ATCC 38327]|uniref:Uncharacterized protein n=1 Tax=Allomyces macrogynus (strain ATCC 38327) TaxID=578462 RepID=A0A0L0SAH1_ALLM3|nr:hypothetical protein AMAG_18183 [Allomyces macrogynus ATCC 38327]|eukprot:KNE59461.1 hypothetical protein AMAG_18183 [Allomyces macrogynus ATCC 38327]